MLTGDRRVLEKICLPVRDAAIEPLAAAIDAREHRRSSEELERAAHGEPFVGTMCQLTAGPRIACGDTEASAEPPFERGDLRSRVLVVRIGYRTAKAVRYIRAVRYFVGYRTAKAVR
jgi:hypothetical protein